MSVTAASLPLTSLAPPPRAFFSFPYFKSFHFTIRTPNHKFSKRLIANADFSSSAPTSSTVDEEREEEEQSYQVLSAMKSDYNDIVIVDTPKSRMLLLDSTHNVHSILYKEQKWTGSYWDEFASLPAIVPKGPIAILGLGGGTAAHLMLHLWPSLQLEGWEIDEILIDKARDYFGLSHLEKTTEGGGILNVHIGDVFIPSENLRRRYAGIVVDLFSEGKVLPQLEEVSTWLELQERLMPDGRFMVNCGGIDGQSSPESLLSNETWLLNPTLKALSKAFPGQEHAIRICQQKESDTYAITS